MLNQIYSKNRIAMLYNVEPGSEGVIRTFDTRPKLLFDSDVMEDFRDWRNVGMAHYYRVNQIIGDLQCRIKIPSSKIGQDVYHTL